MCCQKWTTKCILSSIPISFDQVKVQVRAAITQPCLHHYTSTFSRLAQSSCGYFLSCRPLICSDLKTLTECGILASPHLTKFRTLTDLPHQAILTFFLMNIPLLAIYPKRNWKKRRRTMREHTIAVCWCLFTIYFRCNASKSMYIYISSSPSHHHTHGYLCLSRTNCY